MRTTTTLSLAAITAVLLTTPKAAAQSKASQPAGIVQRASIRNTTGTQVQAPHSARSRTMRPLPMSSIGKADAASSILGGDEERGVAPVNDNCANATLLTVGSTCNPVSGTVDQATQSIAALNCAGFTGNANDDVWYRFVATGPNATIVLECNTSFDGVIDLRSGVCNGTNIACADAWLAGGSETLYATGLVTGTTYRFRIYDYVVGYPVDPTFTVCVYNTPAPPPNDLCEDAVIQTLSVPGSVTVNGDNTGATDTELNGMASAWEAFTISTCADVTIDYCGTTPAFLNAFLNLRIGCPEVDFFPSTDFDATTCGDDNLTIRYTDVPAGTYYYPVLTEPGAEGPYTINFSAVACGGTGGPANDFCSDAIPVGLDAGSSVVFSGVTTGATDLNDFVPGSSLDVGGDTVTVWHAFTTTECTDITVSYCGTDPLPDSYWAFLSTACPAGDDVLLFDDGNFTDCADGNATLFFYNVPAGTYYLPVRGEPSTAGPYMVEVSAAACVTAGPYCEAGSVSSAFETIGNVLFAGLDNTSVGGSGYQNFTAQTAVVVLGQSYPLQITVDGGYATDQALVWIDLDQSESFDPDELVFTSLIGAGPYSGTIAVPSDAALGQTRMRVRLHDTYTGTGYQNTPNATPCDTSTFGQVEDYTVTITGGGAPPVNDQCGDVIVEGLTVGGSVSFSGDNTGATMDGDYEPGSILEGEGLPSVWHAFTTTECANVTVSYCGTDPAFLNFWIVLATTCPANDDLVFYSSFNTTDCGDDNATVYYNNLPAGTYYLPVMMDLTPGFLAYGPYSIEVSATECLPPPANDDCAGAIMLDVDLTCAPVQGTVQDASQSLPATSCNTTTGNANDDVWYAFVATGPNETITVDGTDTLDAVVELFEGTCAGLNSLACADATFGGEVEEIAMNDLIEGTTYYVRVYDWYGGYPIAPTFDICVTGDVGTAVSAQNVTGFELRPNPTEGVVTIDLADGSGKVQVEVLDMAGRLVHGEQRVIGQGQSLVLDLSSKVSAGIYTVRLTTEGRRAERRLLVK